LDSTGGVILDLTGVDYASSAALKVLEERARSGPPVIVYGACEAVRLTLDISGIGTALELVPSRHDAIARLTHRID
jgi:anti-anti-sigma regulatory factor